MWYRLLLVGLVVACCYALVTGVVEFVVFGIANLFGLPFPSVWLIVGLSMGVALYQAIKVLWKERRRKGV